jgi:hypothetical protein
LILLILSAAPLAAQTGQPSGQPSASSSDPQAKPQGSSGFTRPLATAGSWKAFEGRSDDGTAICGLSSDTGGRYFAMKRYAGYDTITIQIGAHAWKLPEGEKVEMNMRYDANPGWVAKGTVIHFGDGDAGLEFDVGQPELVRFRSEFRNSNVLRITFNGALPDWQVDLGGTSAVETVFQDCMRKMK